MDESLKHLFSLLIVYFYFIFLEHVCRLKDLYPGIYMLCSFVLHIILVNWSSSYHLYSLFAGQHHIYIWVTVMELTSGAAGILMSFFRQTFFFASR